VSTQFNIVLRFSKDMRFSGSGFRADHKRKQAQASKRKQAQASASKRKQAQASASKRKQGQLSRAVELPGAALQGSRAPWCSPLG